MRQLRIGRSAVPWIESGDVFPMASKALGPFSEMPGLVAAGLDLDARMLLDAYGKGIFPWFSEGQPVLWWSTDPRMALYVDEFRVHRSFAKTLRACARDPRWEVRLDHDFTAVMRACAGSLRHGQDGTWITDGMIAAYGELHRMGHAHSFETWFDGELAGGGYGVSIGRMFFGESMFARRSDASKIGLAALVFWLRTQDFRMLDCQQNTRHLASLGAHEIPRERFCAELAELVAMPAPEHWPERLAIPLV
ncbi:leucyl/phenylalanyl-tRNA--protein transferase [Derxia gummosa]|uniref:Leucyl/phenylalanyl-tRNA--protein transferase n=1 Tax=Derxia gummosa DSM 723 TaxID=1121388 RepID=A0A8B6X5U9_9BURK|nr:leucyl/phenylalanyl-tRNA--protein transferase [Derxia gummosa]